MYAGAVVLLWATVASAFKLSLRYVEAPHMLLYATLVSTAVLLVVAVWQGKLGQALACSRKQYLRSAAVGFLSPFLYYLVLFEAYDRLPAQEAQPLNYTWPVVVVILSAPLLKQPIGRVSLAAIGVSFVGVLVIATRGDLLSFRFSDPIGTALAVGSAFIWAAFWLTNVRDDRDAVVKLLLNFGLRTDLRQHRGARAGGPASARCARHRGVGVRGRLRDGGHVRALDARAVALTHDRAGQQPHLSVAVPVAGPDQRLRRGDDPAVDGDWAAVHRGGDRDPSLRSDRAPSGLRGRGTDVTPWPG